MAQAWLPLLTTFRPACAFRLLQSKQIWTDGRTVAHAASDVRSIAPRFFRAFRRMVAQRVRLCRSLSTMRHIERLLKTKRLAKPPFRVRVRLIWRVFWRLMPMIADPSSRALRHVRRLRLSPHRRWRVNSWPNSALKSNPTSRALARLPCASSQSISRPCVIPLLKSNLLPFVAHRRKLLEPWKKKLLRRARWATRLAARPPWRYTALLPPWGRIAAAA